MDAVTRTIQGRKRGSMSKRELIRFLKEEIPKLPTNYDRVYDAVTLDEGISDCIDFGRRQAYELILNKLESKDREIVISRNLCDSCMNNGCIFQSGIVRNHCDFYKAESEE